MATAYCNTCGGTYSSYNYDNNRCSNCGNLFNAMALTTSSTRNTTALSFMANSVSQDARNVISEANRSGSSVEYGNAQGNLASGNYKAETLNYNPNSGDFSYSKVVFRK